MTKQDLLAELKKKLDVLVAERSKLNSSLEGVEGCISAFELTITIIECEDEQLSSKFDGRLCCKCHEHEATKYNGYCKKCNAQRSRVAAKEKFVAPEVEPAGSDPPDAPPIQMTEPEVVVPIASEQPGMSKTRKCGACGSSGPFASNRTMLCAKCFGKFCPLCLKPATLVRRGGGSLCHDCAKIRSDKARITMAVKVSGLPVSILTKCPVCGGAKGVGSLNCRSCYEKSFGIRTPPVAKPPRNRSSIPLGQPTQVCQKCGKHRPDVAFLGPRSYQCEDCLAGMSPMERHNSQRRAHHKARVSGGQIVHEEHGPFLSVDACTTVAIQELPEQLDELPVSSVKIGRPAGDNICPACRKRARCKDESYCQECHNERNRLASLASVCPGCGMPKTVRAEYCRACFYKQHAALPKSRPVEPPLPSARVEEPPRADIFEPMPFVSRKPETRRCPMCRLTKTIDVFTDEGWCHLCDNEAQYDEKWQLRYDRAVAAAQQGKQKGGK